MTELHISDTFSVTLHDTSYTSRWRQVTSFIRERFKYFVQNCDFIWEQGQWLFSWMSHWIIQSTESFKNTDWFRNQRLTESFSQQIHSKQWFSSLCVCLELRNSCLCITCFVTIFVVRANMGKVTGNRLHLKM